MKIAFFTDIYAPWGTGGVATSIKAQKEGLERLGHEVVVFCPGKRAYEDNVVTVPVNKHVKVNDSVLASRPSIIMEYILKKYPNFGEFDIVHVQYEASCSLAGVMLAKQFNIPLVQTMHGREDMAITVNTPFGLRTLSAAVLTRLHKKCLPYQIKIKRDKFQAPTTARAKMWELMVNQAECADVVITPSDHFAKKLEHYGVTKPIEAISNGISADLLEMDFKKRKFKDGDVLKMVWGSRVSSEKRIMPFLQALTHLKRPYMVYIYGNGNALAKAKEYATRHKLKVKFFGMQPHAKIVERMRNAHLSVLASYNFDTQGMTLLEAEATGLPVFFCDPALRETVPAGSYVLANGPEAVEMAMSLDAILPEQIEAMSEVMLKNRKNVAQDIQTKKILKVYKKAKELHKENTK